MIRLAIVSPCYNEEAVLEQSAAKIETVMKDLMAKKKITDNSFVLYVNDGSQDATWDIITRLYKQGTTFRGINLAHNVGHQNALMAGMMTARTMADAVITMDCDLQDDVNAIEKMIDKHSGGEADIVFGVKVSRDADTKKKRYSAELYYKMLQAMGVKTIYNHADFRLLSRQVLDTLALYPERNLYLRGLIANLGFKTSTVDDVIQPRLAGESKYTLQKMARLATDGITSFSTRPIEMIITAGAVMMLIALCMFIYVIISICMQHYTAGWASLMMSLWFIGSVVTIAIGIVGIYIGKIYIEVKRRPLYTIAEKLTDEKE